MFMDELGHNRSRKDKTEHRDTRCQKAWVLYKGWEPGFCPQVLQKPQEGSIHLKVLFL